MNNYGIHTVNRLTLLSGVLNFIFFTCVRDCWALSISFFLSRLRDCWALSSCAMPTTIAPPSQKYSLFRGISRNSSRRPRPRPHPWPSTPILGWKKSGTTSGVFRQSERSVDTEGVKKIKSEPEFVNLFRGARESIPSLAGRYHDYIWRTSLPEPVFVNLLWSSEIDSQPGRPVR